jgi:hypothetical protein
LLLANLEADMGLMDSLRRAGHEGEELVRRGMEKARNGVEDAESTMRRKMRVHPRATTTAAPPKAEKDPAEGGIVSIHGRDIDPEELDKNAA